MFHHLQNIAKKEKIKITDDALKLIVRRGSGSFRDSLSLLDQITTLTKDEITAELLSQALGLPQDQLLQSLLQAYADGNKASVHNLLKDLLNSGIKPEIIASELINQIISTPQDSWLPLLAKLPSVQPPFPEAKLLLALLEFGAVTAPRANDTVTQPTPITAQIKPTVAPPASAATHPTNPAAKPNEPEQPPSKSPTNFNWDTFLDNIHADSDGLYQQLQKVDYELTGDTLHIYPINKFNKGILEKPAHQQLLIKHLGGFALELHQLGEKQPPKDETLSQISAIMGNIKEVTGDSPF